MKYALLQLKKFKLPLHEESTLNLEEELVGFEDILEAGPCEVSETLSKLSDDLYEIKAHIKISLVLESCISLEKVPYQIDTDAVFDFTTNKDESEDSDAIVIEKGTIDTHDAIVTEILCNKPMTVMNDDEELIYEEPEKDPEDSINPAFKDLADLLKK